jgi:hypothetical protein
MENKHVIFWSTRVTISPMVQTKAGLNVIVWWSGLVGVFGFHDPVNIELAHLAAWDTESVLLCSWEGITPAVKDTWTVNLLTALHPGPCKSLRTGTEASASIGAFNISKPAFNLVANLAAVGWLHSESVALGKGKLCLADTRINSCLTSCFHFILFYFNQHLITNQLKKVIKV